MLKRFQRGALGRSGRIVTAAAIFLFFWIANANIPTYGADDTMLLAPTHKSALKPGDTIHECDVCPVMVVVPAGSFIMGSPSTEQSRSPNEGPQRTVMITKPFAVSKFELTFDEWDACTANGGCNQYRPADEGWGRERQPVINVTWKDAQRYVSWLSQTIGKTYRLLTEAEYEYAARAGTQTPFPWGDEIGEGKANCMGCGAAKRDKPVPVGSFAPNKFGLYDMVGNVWAWVQDCVHNDYKGAPTNGSIWVEGGNCDGHIVRGGSWFSAPPSLRSASRSGDGTENRSDILGIRVGRTLD